MSSVRKLACPACGGSLEIDSVFTSLIVCPYCGQSLFVHDSGVDPTGQTAKLVDLPSRLAVGRPGAVQGRAFRVLGRVRFANDDGPWDEWFVQFADSQVGWIEENEGALSLTFKHALTTPVPPVEQVRLGSTLSVNGQRMFVSARGHATVAGAEGQIELALPPGRDVQYITGNASGQALRVLQSEQSISLYIGQPLEFADVVMQES